MYIVLIALLVAAVVGSGLLFAVFALNKTTTPSPPNSVVGNVRFLSSPNAPPGNIDEVITTIQHIPAAPSGEQYYAWLEISSENTSSNHWSLPTQNGSMSYTYIDPQHNNLLTNNPHLFLITLEAAGTDLITPNNMPNNRLYYANLPTTIHNSATFNIRMCPQGGSNSTCFL